MIPEPYKIKTCEPIKLVEREEREQSLKKAHFNTFLLPAEKVYIDLVSDSGTGALSTNQWVNIISADESFAYQTSYFKLMEITKSIFPFKHIFIVHQGRMGEHILFKFLIKKGFYVLSNSLFETTRKNIKYYGGEGIDLPDELGNIDIEKLENFINKVGASKISFILLTLTNNSLGGWPVSFENIKSCNSLLSNYGIPLWFDASRFSENAWFIKEKELPKLSINQIIKKAFSYADGFLMSAKKSGLSSVGGLIGTNNDELIKKIKDFAIVVDGFTSHGGMSGRDIASMAQGLLESTDEDLLNFRIQQLRWFGNLFGKIPILKPTGGLGIYIKTKDFLSVEFPSMAFSNEVWLEGGVRGAPWGDYYRLAVPRRVYTNNHLQYTAEIVKKVFENREKIKDLKSIYPDKSGLGIFGAKFRLRKKLQPQITRIKRIKKKTISVKSV
ncbi:tryptophanase [candidate division WOR-3 bacterium]|nr:tryptophanase [candidate division WOR-3 bacterium]